MFGCANGSLDMPNEEERLVSVALLVVEVVKDADSSLDTCGKNCWY